MGRFSKLETGAGATPAASQPLAAKAAAWNGPAKAEPEYDHAYYAGQAGALFFSGQYKKAMRLYSRAIQMDASRDEPWIGQVLCLLELKEYKEALVWVKRALELFPEEATLIALQGLAYAQQGMVQRGLASSDYAMNRSSRDPLVWVIRGEILSLAGNGNAQFCFDKAIESTHPDDWRVPMQIGLSQLRQKKWPQAARYLKMAAEHEPHNEFLWMRLGYAYERLGLSQSALEAYRAARNLNTGNSEAEDSLRRLTRTPALVRFFRRIFA